MFHKRLHLKRWLKRTVVIFGILFAILAVALTIEHVRGKHALKERITRLNSKGERLRLVDFLPPPVDPTNNAAPQLTEVSNRLTAASKAMQDGPPSLRFASPGNAVVTWRLKDWVRAGKSTNDWASIGRQLEDFDDLLDILRSASEKPTFDSGFDYRKGFVDFQLGPLAITRDVTRILNVATVYQLSRSNLNVAHSNLLALVRSLEQQREPLIISQLVRAANVAFAFNATWEALQAQGWTESQLRQLQMAWERPDLIEDMARSFETERAMSMDFYRQIKGSKATLDAVVDKQDGWEEPFGSFVTKGLVLRWINVPLWRIAWADQDELRHLNRWQALIERERFVRSNSWAAFSKQLDDEETAYFSLLLQDSDASKFERFRFLFSSGPSGVTDIMIRRTMSFQTQQRIAATAIAAHRFRLSAGHFPTDLKELVPTYLSTLPRDEMDGGVLRYRALSTTNFLLYSVGIDGRDDDGDATPPKDETYRQIFDGRDAVWPLPADEVESARAMQSWGKEK